MKDSTDRMKSGIAKITIDTDVEARPYSAMIFGGFLEHFNRQIYGGIFDPGSPLSDNNGYRKDVRENSFY